MAAQSLPGAALEKIRSIAGNKACMDCGSPDPDWGDVLNGTLVCINCAGQHRALGVNNAFCRSLTMDNWTEANLLAMLLGGNRQLKSFFERQRIENSAPNVLYRTKQAAYYREQLAAQVNETLGKRKIMLSQPEKTGPVLDFDVEIRTESLGASLTRALPPPGQVPIQQSGNGSMPLVTRVKSNSVAASAGLRVGDYVVAMNGRSVVDYDEFVSLFPRTPRPLRLTVRRFAVFEEPEQAPEAAVTATFDAGPMGFSIERDPENLGARVSKVAPGGQAAARGVAVGDVVVGLGNRDTPTYDVVIATLSLLPRPLDVKFDTRGRVAKPQGFSRGRLDAAPSKKKPLADQAPVSTGSGGFGASFRAPVHKKEANTTKRLLGDPEDDNEFDVLLQDGPLGMRIEERAGLVPITLVTHVDSNGQAYEAGVRRGDVILGINAEPYLSHAHTASTLRHAKRPIQVRMRHSD